MASNATISKFLPCDFQLLSYSQIASLWSNYGHIYRLQVKSANPSSSSRSGSLILKSIHPPLLSNPSESHLRKMLSYEIERWFYRHLSSRLPASVKVATVYPIQVDDDGNLLLEDLSDGYPYPARGGLGKESTITVLKWLGGFHATFFRLHKREDMKLVPPPSQWMREKVKGVWRRGVYWYLETRREELAQIDEEEYEWLMPWIEKVNFAIDKEIETYGTLLHGDVKGANICFNRELYGRGKPKQPAHGELECALYDFQYVGLGLGVLDLVYFLGTSVEPRLLITDSDELLRLYHKYFLEALMSASDSTGAIYTYDIFLRHWELAVVDWYRFMTGWGFWGNDNWVEARAREIVTRWDSDPSLWGS